MLLNKSINKINLSSTASLPNYYQTTQVLSFRKIMDTKLYHVASIQLKTERDHCLSEIHSFSERILFRIGSKDILQIFILKFYYEGIQLYLRVEFISSLVLQKMGTQQNQIAIFIDLFSDEIFEKYF